MNPMGGQMDENVEKEFNDPTEGADETPDLDVTESAPGDDPIEVAAGSESVLDRIKRDRAERIADETLVVDIPTWDGELKAKYKVVPKAELEMMLRSMRTRKQKAAQLSDKADLRFLLKACVSVIGVDSQTDERFQVAEDYMDRRLVEWLDCEDSSPEFVLLKLFNGNKIAISNHAMRVANWMKDTSADLGDLDAEGSENPQ